MSREFKILSPTAILGYGFPQGSFERGLAERPDLIAVDGGSTDPGPYYLGSGKSFTDRNGVKRDLRLMLTAGVTKGIPVVIGTAGGSGAAPHLEWCRQIVLEIAEEERLSFKLAVIPTDVPRRVVLAALEAGQIQPLDNVPPLTREAVCSSPHIVAQIGIEPFVEALTLGAQVHTQPYRVKLEGARPVGYRAVTIAGVRDPIMIESIDSILAAVKTRVEGFLGDHDDAQVFFHAYGKNGVMGELEPTKRSNSHELGLVLEVVAVSQERANTVCSLLRSTLLHHGYPGRVATAGNLAFPFSPSDIQAGEVYEFSLYHLMDLPKQNLFPVQIEQVGGTGVHP